MFSLAGMHVFWGIGVLAVATAAGAVVRHPVARRRLALAKVLTLGALAVHVSAFLVPSIVLDGRGHQIESLLIACAGIATGVALVFMPRARMRPNAGAPAIVQDTLIAALSVVAAMVVFNNSSFFLGITGSAIVVGLALQDTLGNAFSGLAIQIDKPFRVGHWVRAAGHEGRVMEVTWRATKIRAEAGHMVVLPNSTVAKEAIDNFTEVTERARLSVDVGTSYLTPPNASKEAIAAAVSRVAAVAAQPVPDVRLVDFGASALLYRVHFWIDEPEEARRLGASVNPIEDRDERIRGDVRAAIYYELHRRGIEIPWPIQVEYSRTEEPRDSPHTREEFARMVHQVPVLSGLDAEATRALAGAAVERLFADGEVIVREGESGASLFVVRAGAVRVTVGADRREVAVTEAGGYFGEMSLLTGQPRSATVVARGDCRVLEITAGAFRSYVQSRPEIIDRLAAAAASRQQELEHVRALPSTGAAPEVLSLVQRMRRFFGLS